MLAVSRVGFAAWGKEHSRYLAVTLCRVPCSLVLSPLLFGSSEFALPRDSTVPLVSRYVVSGAV